MYTLAPKAVFSEFVVPLGAGSNGVTSAAYNVAILVGSVQVKFNWCGIFTFMMQAWSWVGVWKI